MPASTIAKPKPEFRKINREAPERPCSSSGASCCICWKGRSAKGNCQPSLGSIITGETHKGGVTAYRCEVPDTPVKITQLSSFRKLPSCTRKCLSQKSDGTICRLSKSGIPASGRGEDRNTFVNAVEAIIILYQNERNKIKILLRLKRMYAIMMASIKFTGGPYAAIP